MKYLALVGIAFRQNLSARASILARLAFYLVLMLIFSRLWAAVGADTERAGVGPVALVWYLALTELVTLATPFLYLAIEEDVRRGDIAYRIARPVSYLGTRLAEAAGEMCVRFVSLATLGFLGAWFFSGGLPDPRGLLLAVPVAFLATLVMLVIQAGVGLSAFWLQEAAPLHWVVQKLVFVFGGLMFPLEIYPDWLHTIASWTPFAAVIHGCGRLCFSYDPALAAWTALRILGWGLVLLVLVGLLYRRGLKILTVNGG